MKLIKMCALTLALTTGIAMAQSTANNAAKQTKSVATNTAAAASNAASAASSSDIANAKAKNLVWVNLNSKVYHFSGNKYYGTTKNGKFMTEADAKAAGYKAAKDAAAK